MTEETLIFHVIAEMVSNRAFIFRLFIYQNVLKADRKKFGLVRSIT